MLVQTGLWVIFLVKLVKLVKKFGPIVFLLENELYKGNKLDKNKKTGVIHRHTTNTYNQNKPNKENGILIKWQHC